MILSSEKVTPLIPALKPSWMKHSKHAGRLSLMSLPLILSGCSAVPSLPYVSLQSDENGATVTIQTPEQKTRQQSKRDADEGEA